MMSEFQTDRKKLNPNLPKEAIAKFCQEKSLVGFYLFGSILTDEFRQDSDVDVMVELKEGEYLTLIQICNMTHELEAMFGRKVDMLTKSGVEAMTNDYVKASILGSAVKVYSYL